MIESTAGKNESVNIVTGEIDPSRGSSGASTMVPGESTSVSAAASATGGMSNFIESDVDSELFHFNSEDAPS